MTDEDPQFSNFACGLNFTVEGNPRTNQRHRIGKGRRYTPEETGVARDEIKMAFARELQYWQNLELPWRGPVRLRIVAEFLKPENWWEGRQCKKTPDWDNMGKLVGDALNGIAWSDDRIIADARVVKRYADKPSLTVRIEFFEPVDKPLHGIIKGTSRSYIVCDQGEPLGRVWKKGRFWFAKCPMGSYSQHRTRAEAAESLGFKKENNE